MYGCAVSYALTENGYVADASPSGGMYPYNHPELGSSVSPAGAVLATNLNGWLLKSTPVNWKV